MALWDWVTTTVGTINIFHAEGILQFIACGVFACAMSTGLLATARLKKIQDLDIALAVLIAIAWLSLIIYSLSTTFTGTAAVIAFKNPLITPSEVADLLQGLTIQEFIIVLISTLFVFASTVALSFLLSDLDNNKNRMTGGDNYNKPGPPQAQDATPEGGKSRFRKSAQDDK
jgi:hypothetical protein